jgi:hypothetical protein
MPTVENQLAWLRLGVSYIGPVTMQEPHRETLRGLCHFTGDNVPGLYTHDVPGVYGHNVPPVYTHDVPVN